MMKSYPGSCGRGRGFTLVEVLVALAIIAVALMAALRVAGQGTLTVGELRSRLLAGWVAENLLAEQRTRGAWPSPGTYRGTAKQGNMDFTWRADITETANPSFRRANISVFAPAGESYLLAHLTGYLAQPAVPGNP
ncbi:MAG: type II secretion system protein GspI [Nitrosomonadales bacterium SCN 54-20]|nr:MAG: type II secretion system protein GspI [Nitrosomonadales bacterium SCN 54-20]